VLSYRLCFRRRLVILDSSIVLDSWIVLLVMLIAAD